MPVHAMCGNPHPAGTAGTAGTQAAHLRSRASRRRCGAAPFGRRQSGPAFGGSERNRSGVSGRQAAVQKREAMYLESLTQLPPTGRWGRQSPAQPPPLGSPAATLPVDCVVGAGTGVCQEQEAEQLGKELGACWGVGGWVGCSFEIKSFALVCWSSAGPSLTKCTCCCQPSYLHFPQADGRSQLHFCAQLSSRPSLHTQQPTCSGVKRSRHYRHVGQYARNCGLRHYDGQGAERRER